MNKVFYYVFAVVLVLAIAVVLAVALSKKEKPSNQAMENIVVLETTKGVIEIELDLNHASLTSANFISYVNSGFYDGLVFHRVIKGFMVQGGGFDANGNQRQTMAPIPLESNNGLKNTVGAIAMARTSNPDSATSQFFINTVDNELLDYSQGNPGYAVFGKVVKGMHVVYAIEDSKTSERFGQQDWPVEDIVITKAYMR